MVYVAKSKNIDNSSSGGIFFLLAENIIKKGGFVSGVIFDENFEAVHIVSNEISDIKKMLGSKYVKSSINGVFEKTKDLLDKEIPVLFSGTPCEIQGLRSFLKKEYKNLITIDLLCHATPEKKVFKKYLKEFLTNDEKIQKIDFRYKTYDRLVKQLMFKIETNKRTVVQPSLVNPYFRGFLNDLFNSKPCSSCKYTGTKRIGDITLGDSWGIGHFNKNINVHDGYSMVILNTKKANKLFDEIKPELKYCEKYNLKDFIPYNPPLSRPNSAHHKRDLFFKNFDRLPFEKNVAMCLDNITDVAILNLWFSCNFGAVLTTYALQELIFNLGYSVKIIDNTMDIYKKDQDNFYKDFKQKYLNLSPPVKDDLELVNLNSNTDTFIVGSDQVFRIDFYGDKYKKHFFDFTCFGKRKIAFSASFGQDYLHCKNEDIKTIKQLLSQFDYISTRETSGVTICREYFNIESDWIIDPVFLAPYEIWENLAKDSSKDFSNKPIAYILDEKDEYNDLTKNCQKINPCENSIQDFIKAFQQAEYIITDSFHGVCFCIIFNKPFYCIKNPTRGSARFDTLIETFNIKDCFEKLTTPNYNEINEKLKILKQYGNDKLKQALEKEIVRDLDKISNYINKLEQENIILKKQKNSYAQYEKYDKTIKLINGTYDNLKD